MIDTTCVRTNCSLNPSPVFYIQPAGSTLVTKSLHEKLRLRVNNI